MGMAFAHVKRSPACLSLEAQGETQKLFLQKLRDFNSILSTKLRAMVRASSKHPGTSPTGTEKKGRL